MPRYCTASRTDVSRRRRPNHAELPICRILATSAGSRSTVAVSSSSVASGSDASRVISRYTCGTRRQPIEAGDHAAQHRVVEMRVEARGAVDRVHELVGAARLAEILMRERQRLPRARPCRRRRRGRCARRRDRGRARAPGTRRRPCPASACRTRRRRPVRGRARRGPRRDRARTPCPTRAPAGAAGGAGWSRTSGSSSTKRTRIIVASFRARAESVVGESEGSRTLEMVGPG